MEGSPDGSFVYLIGLLVQQGDKEQSYSFWADCREEETLFIETLSQFPSGHYERRVFKRTARHFGPALSGRLDGECTNVLSTLYAKAYFPTYSNSLKDVATILGYVWQVPMPPAYRQSYGDTNGKSPMIRSQGCSSRVQSRRLPSLQAGY
jgi:predicted RecB family nuclease